MFYQSESKLQGWRALVIFEDRSECLLYVGRSTTQIRAGYAAAFADILSEEERAQVRAISLQCWQGAPDRGHWLPKGTLTVPGRKPVPAAADDEESDTKLLPLRRRRTAADGEAADKEDARLAPTA